MRFGLFEGELHRQLKQHETNDLLLEHDTKLIEKYARDNKLREGLGYRGVLLNFLQFIRVMNKEMLPLKKAVNYMAGEMFKLERKIDSLENYLIVSVLFNIVLVVLLIWVI